ISLDVGQVHFVENKKVWRAEILWLRCALDEIECRPTNISRGVETIRVPENVFVTRPVGSDRNERVGGWLSFLGSPPEPPCECLCELGLARAGKPAQDEKTLCAERGGETQQNIVS